MRNIDPLNIYYILLILGRLHKKRKKQKKQKVFDVATNFNNGVASFFSWSKSICYFCNGHHKN